MGYPYIYPIGNEDEENFISMLTQEDIEKNAELINELQNFLKNLELKRLSESKAVMCGIEKENVKKFISVDADGCSVLDYSSLLSFLNGIHIES